MSTWGIAFGDTVLEGDFTIGSHDVNFASGTGIIRFPDDGTVIIPPSLKVISHNQNIIHQTLLSRFRFEMPQYTHFRLHRTKE